MAEPSCIELDRVAVEGDPGTAARASHRAFLELVEPHRPALWRFCRSLCRTPWDAEDLLQESLSRAYAKLPLLWQAVDLSSYLRGIARNCWSDLIRGWSDRPAAVPAAGSDRIVDADVVAARDALHHVLSAVSPRQAAVLLYTGLGFSSAEIAERLAMSSGAVRTETSRARARLLQAGDGEASQTTPLLDAFVRAFNAHDLAGMEALLAAHARAVIVGVAEEQGRSTILANSLADDLASTSARASLHELHGETVVAVTDNGSLSHLMRVEAAGGLIAEIRTYFFCPELLAEVAAAFGISARDNSYYFEGS